MVILRVRGLTHWFNSRCHRLSSDPKVRRPLTSCTSGLAEITGAAEFWSSVRRWRRGWWWCRHTSLQHPAAFGSVRMTMAKCARPTTRLGRLGPRACIPARACLPARAYLRLLISVRECAPAGVRRRRRELCLEHRQGLVSASSVRCDALSRRTLLDLLLLHRSPGQRAIPSFVEVFESTNQMSEVGC